MFVVLTGVQVRSQPIGQLPPDSESPQDLPSVRSSTSYGVPAVVEPGTSLPFPVSLAGNAKSRFYANEEAMSAWEQCSNAFPSKSFSLGKENALRSKVLAFNSSHTSSSQKTGIPTRVHFGEPYRMEEWFII